MALTLDGTLLLAANNAEDPPFATLFHANGDSTGPSNVTKIIKITVDPTIIPSGAGLSLEQPTWEPTTQRFYISIPVIAGNPGGIAPGAPGGCNYGQNPTPITCDGGLLVFDPKNLTSSQCNRSLLPAVCQLSFFNAATYTGVIELHPANQHTNPFPFTHGSGCSPNGITVGPNSTILLGCTPGNNPSDGTTQVINAKKQVNRVASNFADIADITGSDEVWFNPSIYAPPGFIGDKRYYLAASKAIGGAVLGVVDETSVLIETIPQSSNSHSVAADAARNLIWVPQVAPASVVGTGGDTTMVGQQLCGGTDGCVVVYGSPGPHPAATGGP
jgi:hypothetical protein